MDDVVEIWNAVLAKASREGEAALSEEEAVVYHANRFASDFGLGRLSGYLYNLSPTAGESPEWERLARAITAIRRVGARDVATHLQAAHAILSHPRARNRARTWETFLERADPEGALDAIAGKLRTDARNVRALLVAYTEAHRDLLPQPLVRPEPRPSEMRGAKQKAKR
jgi:hypothetical protein